MKRNFSPSDWTLQYQTAFETLKQALMSPPVLRFVDMDKEFVLSTDASGGAFGYVLGQKDEDGKEYVIAYGGRARRTEEQQWHRNELECLAIIAGIDAYKHYLSHKHFTISTDNAAMKWLMEKKEPTGKFARWIMKIQSFSFTIEHRKSTQNADAISRIDYSRFPCSTAPQNEPSSCNNPTTCQSTQSKSQEQTFTSSTSLTHPIQSDKVEVSASEPINTAYLDGQKELIQVTFEYENMPSISSIEDENETKEADLSDIFAKTM